MVCRQGHRKSHLLLKVLSVCVLICSCTDCGQLPVGVLVLSRHGWNITQPGWNKQQSCLVVMVTSWSLQKSWRKVRLVIVYITNYYYFLILRSWESIWSFCLERFAHCERTKKFYNLIGHQQPDFSPSKRVYMRHPCNWTVRIILRTLFLFLCLFVSRASRSKTNLTVMFLFSYG